MLPKVKLGAALKLGNYVYVRAGTECLHLELLRERDTGPRNSTWTHKVYP